MAAPRAFQPWRLLIVTILAAVQLADSTRADAKTAPLAAEITAVIEDQFAGFREPNRTSSLYAKDAMLAMTGGSVSPQVNRLSDAEGKWTLFGPSKVGKHKVRDLRVTAARDGKSAWASFNVKVAVDGLAKTGTIELRATELFVKEAGAWQIRGAAWSSATAAATLQKAAKAGTLAGLETVFDQHLGDRDVMAAIKALAETGLDSTATARKDIVGIGVATGERAIGGKQLAARLAKDWGTKVELDGSIWALTAGTTACATVNVKLERGGSTLPARLFVVFERTKDGGWSPVLVHLAAAPPS
jgi:hypothetical protein